MNRFRRLIYTHCRNHRRLSIILSAYDDRYEYDSDIGIGPYSPFQVILKVIKAVLLKKTCWHCNGRGTTGYYEPEACSVCNGYCYNWTGEQEPDWGGMADWLRANPMPEEKTC